MAKVVIKAECLTQNNTANGSNVTFIVKAPANETPAIPGQPMQAKRVINFNFDDDTAKQYIPKKPYTITIE